MPFRAMVVRRAEAMPVPDPVVQSARALRKHTPAAAGAENSYSPVTCTIHGPPPEGIRHASTDRRPCRSALHLRARPRPGGRGRARAGARAGARAAGGAAEQAGERLLPRERGEPDFDTPAHIVEALARAARDGYTHYPDARGGGALRGGVGGRAARAGGSH